MRKLLLFALVCALTAGALERQPNADYRARRVALSKMTDGGVVVLFAPMEEEGQDSVWGFRQDPNFYYLTGWAEPGAALVIAPEVPAKDDNPGRAYSEILFLPAHNLTQERWTGPKLGPEDPKARQLTGFDRLEVLDSLRNELVKLLPQPRATAYSDLPEFGHNPSSAKSLEWLQRTNTFPNYISFEDVKPLLSRLRMVKDKGELALMRKATEASVAAHRAAMKATRPGVTEREIAGLMQFEMMKRGCERPAYSPIVGSGFNSTVLHYSENSRTMQAGETVVMDVGGEYSMYGTDITRTLPVSGKFTPRQREIYDIVLGAQQAAIQAFQAGKSTLARTGRNSLYQVALDYINSHGKDLKGERLGKYFIHGLGHYVGLGVHDANDANRPLDKGMVFTIEPGIYIPEEKLGVRIEDIHYVDEDGKLVNLSGALPSTADEVERAMAE